MWFAQTISTTSVEFTTADEKSFLATLAAWWIVYVIVWVLYVVALWKVFTKADEAGWKSIIPFYSSYIMFRIAGRNGWWFLVLFIPVVNIFVLLMLALDMAKHFGKSNVFGIFGLWLFSVIGYIILGYGDAKYVGPKHD